MTPPLTCPVCDRPLDEHQPPKAVARSLGIGQRSVRRLLALGELDGIRIGHTWRICPHAARTYIDRCMERSSA